VQFVIVSTYGASNNKLLGVCRRLKAKSKTNKEKSPLKQMSEQMKK